MQFRLRVAFEDPPQENPMLVDPADLRRRPAAHVPDVRHNPRTRLQVSAQLLTQLEVRRRVQEKGHDGGGPDVRLIHVAEPELHSVLDAGLTRVRLRLRHQGRVDLNPYSTRAELLCRGDRDAPVPGPEIVDEVLRADPASSSSSRTIGIGVGS